MKKAVKGITLFFFAGTLLLSGCVKAPQMEFDSADEAKEALNTAETIVIYSDLYSGSRKTEILADGKVAGYMQGNTVYLDNEEWFHIDYVTDAPVNDVEEFAIGTTYGYYDKDDNCLGYAQQRYVGKEDDPDGYFVFMDTDGSELPYFISDNGRVLYDGEGNPIGTGYTDRKSISFIEKLYTDVYRTVFETDQTESQMIDFMDRIIMYECLRESMRTFYEEPVHTGLKIFETLVIIIPALGVSVLVLADKLKNKLKEKQDF